MTKAGSKFLKCWFGSQTTFYDLKKLILFSGHVLQSKEADFVLMPRFTM